MIPAGRMFGCPVELALELLGGKWKTIILARLKEAPLRYGDLRRALPDLADKVLTQRLREMHDDGFVDRTEDGAAVWYRVSERGRSLAPALEALYAWGEGQGRLAGARFRTDRLATDKTGSGDA